MVLSLTDVIVVSLTAISVGFGIGLGVGLVHISVLSFMRYAVDYAEKLKKHRITETNKDT